MKIKINKNGDLITTNCRGTSMIAICPFRSEGNLDIVFCGEWCPHFRVERGSRVYIRLCQGTTLDVLSGDFSIDE
jgi:hypothetical protein